MTDKEYCLGLLVGRFQIVHSGHEEIIRKTIELCDTVGVFIGSSQEQGTAKNPFSYEQREEMLKTLFGNKIIIYPLPDLGAGNNCIWGRYVLDNAYSCFGRYPDLFVSGEEKRRVSWFTPEMCPGMTELAIAKTTDISASQMRKFIINGDYDSWKKYSNPALWNRFPELREVILRCCDVLETSSL